MSIWDRVKGALGAPRSTGDVALDGERVVLKDLDRARAFSQEPAQPGPTEMKSCERCSAPVRQVVFTTAGSGEQTAVWRAYPLAVDGWLCRACGLSVSPRRISAEESAEYGRNGAAHARSGNLDDAEFWFRRILASWPGYPAAYADLAQVQMSRANASGELAERLRYRQEALNLFRKAVAASNGQPPGLIRLPFARALALSGNEEEALVHLQALDADVALDEAIRLEGRSLVQDIRDGKALFTRATELVKGLALEPPAKALTPERRTLLEQGRALLREADGRKAAFHSAWFLGKVELRLGDFEAAAKALERACELNPQQPDGQRELCSVYLHLGRNSDALPVARRALELHPGDATLRANLALVLLLTSDLEGALREVSAARAADPTDAITRTLAKVIDDVAAGRRKHPRTLAELEGRSGR
jgi:tetratricopeptide (TPR) repeat protein